VSAFWPLRGRDPHSSCSAGPCSISAFILASSPSELRIADQPTKLVGSNLAVALSDVSSARGTAGYSS
jgi:hypothetical protein